MKRFASLFLKICPLAIALIFLLAGCNSQRVLICGGRIHNAAGRELSDITIVHQPTGQMLRNNLLPAESDVDLAFADRELRATSATIEWNDTVGGPQQVTLALPSNGGTAGPQRLIYEIHGAGQVQARLVPCH